MEKEQSIKEPKQSPLGHRHQEVVIYINPETGVSTSFQWDGIKEIYYLAKERRYTL